MRVLYVLNTSNPTNGATKAFMNMLRGVMALGVTPYVVMPDSGGIVGELETMGVECYTFTYRHNTYPYFATLKEKVLFLPRTIVRWMVNRRAARQLVLILRQKKIDLVHTNTGVVNIGYEAALKLNIPHVYHIREYADRIQHYFPWKRSFLCQLAHSHSICITNDVQRYYGQDGSALSRVIYDGVREAVPEMPVSEQRDSFLYVGRIQPVKGLMVLLQAYFLYCQRVSEPLPLRVVGGVGNIAYAQETKQFVESHRLEHLVSFLGDQQNIDAFYRQARALVIPSSFEGFGFCMPEAMLNGCLVVARNMTGTKEQLDNGLQETGEEIALRFETAEELADCLEKVAGTPLDDFLPMMRRAFSVVNRLYTVNACANQVYLFYKDILSRF